MRGTRHQSLTDLDSRGTVLSIDGIGAFAAMLDGLQQVRGDDTVLPFVLQFYSDPSQYLWTDDSGDTHVIHQGEGGEQGGALMPMLYALGQHGALLSLQDFLLPDEHLYGYLDDMYVVCLPDRAGPIFKHLQEALAQYARIQVHLGKTQVWNRGGHFPPACVEMQAAADRADPQSQARIWRGAGLPSEQGVRVLGIPIGNEEHVQAELPATTEKHSTLLNRIPLVQDLQSAWLLLLFCANTRATYSLRGIPPAETEQFAVAHDVATWQCFTQLLGISGVGETQDWARLPFQMGGCGLRSATRIRVPAHWASWADSLRMIHSRHPGVAATMVRCLVGPTDSRHFSSAASCRAVLRESGFDAPEWEAFIPGALAVPEQGWQHDASLVMEQRFVYTVVVPRASPAHRAMLRSQGGPLSGLPFTTLPLSPLQRFDSHLFRVLLLRRLHLPLLPWPSPCKLLEGRGSWEARLRTGVCCGSGLPRGRRQSLSECVLARPRPAHRCHGSAPDRGDR